MSERIEVPTTDGRTVLGYVVLFILSAVALFGVWCFFRPVSVMAFDPCTGHGVECCQQLANGEPYSRSCETWAKRPGFPLCCGIPEPSPSPSIELCDAPTPTPLPTPEDRRKGPCCAITQKIFRNAWIAIVDRKNVEMRALRKWKAEQMEQCRSDYQHQPAPW